MTASVSAGETRRQDVLTREQIVAACQILAAEGHSEGLAGQITARTSADSKQFITLPFDRLFDEVAERDLCVIDDDLNLVEGDGPVNPALRFHLWLYKARPDVQCLVHTHPPYTAALSMTGRALKVAHMDTAMFYEDCAYLSEWPGVPFGDDEGRIISECIGDKRSILLASHGYITAGSSVAEATYLAVFFERAAKMQIRAEAIGEIHEVEPARAREAHDFLLSSDIVEATFAAWRRRVAGSR